MDKDNIIRSIERQWLTRAEAQQLRPKTAKYKCRHAGSSTSSQGAPLLSRVERKFKLDQVLTGTRAAARMLERPNVSAAQLTQPLINAHRQLVQAADDLYELISDMKAARRGNEESSS